MQPQDLQLALRRRRLQIEETNEVLCGENAHSSAILEKAMGCSDEASRPGGSSEKKQSQHDNSSTNGPSLPTRQYWRSKGIAQVPSRHGYNFHDSPWAESGPGGACGSPIMPASELKQAEADAQLSQIVNNANDSARAISAGDIAVCNGDLSLPAVSSTQAPEILDVIVLLDESRERWRQRHHRAAEEVQQAVAEATAAESALASLKDKASREQEASIAPVQDIVTVMEEARNRWRGRYLQAEQERDRLQQANEQLQQLEHQSAEELREVQLKLSEAEASTVATAEPSVHPHTYCSRAIDSEELEAQPAIGHLAAAGGEMQMYSVEDHLHQDRLHSRVALAKDSTSQCQLAELRDTREELAQLEQLRADQFKFTQAEVLEIRQHNCQLVCEARNAELRAKRSRYEELESHHEVADLAFECSEMYHRMTWAEDLVKELAGNRELVDLSATYERGEAAARTLSCQKKTLPKQLDLQCQRGELKECLHNELALALECTASTHALASQQEAEACTILERVQQETNALREEHAALQESRASTRERSGELVSNLCKQLCLVQEESRCSEQQHARAVAILEQETQQLLEERMEVSRSMSAELLKLQDKALHRWSCVS